jgi:hypothetical protein
MIDLKQYQAEIDDIEVGDTARVNHELCTAGEDTRRRLYITRPHASPDRVIAYCHNCQESGVLSTGDNAYIKYRDNRHSSRVAQSILKDEEEIELPAGLVYQLSDWTQVSKAWAYKARLNTPLVAKYKIGEDPSTGRVCLPQWRATTPRNRWQLDGYQLRKTDPNVRGPKYLTVRRKDTPRYSELMDLTYKNKCAVIVEDLASGIHVFEAMAGLARVYVNYGVDVDTDTLEAALAGNKPVVVWLDNDSEHVDNQAKMMARTLSLIGDQPVQIVEVFSDPKHQDYDEIRSIVNGHC